MNSTGSVCDEGYLRLLREAEPDGVERRAEGSPGLPMQPHRTDDRKPLRTHVSEPVAQNGAAGGWGWGLRALELGSAAVSWILRLRPGSLPLPWGRSQLPWAP